jgi:hypothetical protein
LEGWLRLYLEGWFRLYLEGWFRLYLEGWFRPYLEGWFRFLIAWFCGFISDTDEHGYVPFVVFTVASLFPPS